MSVFNRDTMGGRKNVTGQIPAGSAAFHLVFYAIMMRAIDKTDLGGSSELWFLFNCRVEMLVVDSKIPPTSPTDPCLPKGAGVSKKQLLIPSRSETQKRDPSKAWYGSDGIATMAEKQESCRL